jgi:ketosteroid isomerase-like protein
LIALVFLSAFSDPATHFDPFLISERDVLFLSSDVAIVTATARISGQTNGNRFREHFRYSDIFRRLGGDWQVVFVQVTRLPD